jgi:hypothetical protein
MNLFTRCAPFVALLGMLSVADCFGTHIVAGEIICQPDAGSSTPYAYNFTLRIYRDVRGVDQPSATLNFGVNGAMQTIPVSSREMKGVLASPDIEALVYNFKYTYPGPGTYTVSFTEENRNAGVVNMFQSINTPFHIETTFTISATLGYNSTPQFLNPPIFQAFVGQKVCINPAAYDAEGDSLSYRLIVPLGRVSTEVTGYQLPNQVTPSGVSESRGASTFTINELTGEICWDTPGSRKRDGGIMGVPGDFAQYAVAFVVDEWRNRVKISSTVRDFGIFVSLPEAPKPELRAENAAAAGFNADRLVRVEPGQPLTFSVLYKGTGAAADSLVPVSETFRLARKATASVTDSAGFTKATYTWTPTEAERRSSPYVVVFRGASGKTLLNDLTFGVFVGTDIPAGRVTATEDEVNGRKLRLFPNPTRHKVRLAQVPGTGAAHFQLTDALGRQAYASANLRGTNYEVDLTALPNGLYAYTVTAGGRVVGTGRLLKQ